MHTKPRTSTITKLVLHTNEGPEGDNSAAGLANYLLNNGADGGGYQWTFDNAHTVTVQPDNVVCWANGAINDESLDGCIVGYAAQSAAEWADAFDLGAIEQAAQKFAEKCKEYGIPAVLLTGSALHDSNARGITTHGLLTQAGYSGTMGHTDPGPNFPIEAFVGRVNAILNPAPSVNWISITRIAGYVQAITTRAMRVGDKGTKILRLKTLLVKNGYPMPEGDVYGPEITKAVAAFKAKHGFVPRDGTTCGRRVVLALLKRA